MAWRDLTDVNDDFFAAAPTRTTVTLDVPVDRAALWATLSADDAVVSWSPLVTAARWTSDGRGVGAVREVELGKLLTVRERFYRWDINERMTFSATATTGPGIRSFAEDYILTDTANGSRLQWTVAMSPAIGASVIGPIAGPVLHVAVAALARGLGRKVV